MWALVGGGLGIAALVAACYVARMRRRKKPALIDPSLSSSLCSIESDSCSIEALQHRAILQADAAHTPASAHTVAYSLPYKGMLLDGTAHMREEVKRMRSYSFERRGSARARAMRSKPIKLQLLAAPEFGNVLGYDKYDSDAPAWSALVMDGVTVPYDEVVSVKMDQLTLVLTVEHKPRNQHGTNDPPLKHLGMHSRSEFNLWREALHPKVANPDLTLKVQPLDTRRSSFARKLQKSATSGGSKASQINAARNWLSSREASADTPDFQRARSEENLLYMASTNTQVQIHTELTPSTEASMMTPEASKAPASKAPFPDSPAGEPAPVSAASSIARELSFGGMLTFKGKDLLSEKSNAPAPPVSAAPLSYPGFRNVLPLRDTNPVVTSPVVTLASGPTLSHLSLIPLPHPEWGGSSAASVSQVPEHTLSHLTLSRPHPASSAPPPS